MDKIVIDGQDFTPDVLDGLEGLELEYGLFDRSYNYQTSTPVLLGKKGYEYIKSKFFSNCNDIENKVDIAYYNDCCDIWLDLEAGFKGVEICSHDCQSTIQMTQEQDSCYDYLCSKVPGQDGYSDVANLMQFRYRIQGGIFNRFLFIFLPMLTLITYVISLLINAIALICKVIDAIPLVNINCPDFIAIDKIACELSRFVSGTGNYHVGASLTEMLEYYISKCGLTLESSILKDHPQYSCLSFLLSTNTEGQDVQSDPKWIQENVPPFSIKEILDDLADNVFNADWIIKDSVLYFDRKDRIEGLREELITWESLEGRLDKTPCISFCDDTAPAFLEFDWCTDSLNRQGEKQKRCFSGNVDWNEDQAPWKSGSKQVRSQIFTAHVRGMNDTTWTRDTSFFKWDIIFDIFAKGDYGKALSVTPVLAAFGGFLNIILSILVCDDPEDCAMVMSGDTTSCTPLLVFDKTSDNSDKKILKRPTGDVLYGCTIYEYNYPLSVVKQNDDDSFTQGQLYNEFWSLCDPNEHGNERFQMTELSWQLTCEELQAIHESDCGWYIPTPYGRANVNTIKVKTDGSIASVKTAKMRCFS